MIIVFHVFVVCGAGKKVGDIDLKSFMPRDLNGVANRLNVKRNAEKLVETCQNREASFVRERYLFKVRNVATV